MKILIHFAMKEEAAALVNVEGIDTLPALIEGDSYDILISGIGAPALNRSIQLIDWSSYVGVYNIGYVGTNYTNLNIGDLIQVNTVRHLDFKLPETDPMVHPTCDYGYLNLVDTGLQRVPCFSSNRFVTQDHLNYIFGQEAYETGVYDMELATLYDYTVSVAIPLTSIKVISDNLNNTEFDTSVVNLSEKIKEAVDIVLSISKENDDE